MVKAPSFLQHRGGNSSGDKAGKISSSSSSNQLTSTSTTASSYYQKKYKPWRKGKSSKVNGRTVGSGGNAKNHGSLKQQLRGLQRLQQKKLQDRDPNPTEPISSEEDRIHNQQELELQEKIDALQEQIQSRSISEKERINATKSHKLRFIDRQRTTRLYQQYMKQLQQQQQSTDEPSPTEGNDDDDDDDDESPKTQRRKIREELYKLALDQIYIAHYPLDKSSYVSIFNPTSTSGATANSVGPTMSSQTQQQRRTIMNNRLLHKLSTQRQFVIERLYKSNNLQKLQNDRVDDDDNSNNNNNIPDDDNDDANIKKQNIASKNNPKHIPHVSWIHTSQYERIQHLQSWSTQLERTTFNITIVNNNNNNNNGKSSESHTSNASGDPATNQDLRFHNENMTFNTTQQLLLQEQERIERELQIEEEEEEADVDAANKRAKTNPTLTNYDNDESNSSDDYGNDNDDDDDDVDPIKLGVSAAVSSVTLRDRNNGTNHKNNNNEDNVSDNNDSNDDDDCADDDAEDDDDDSTNNTDRNKADNTTGHDEQKNDGTHETTSHSEVIATATSLRKLASQKGNIVGVGNNMDDDEEDDFFVSIDDNDDNYNVSKTTNVFTNAKRDTQRYQNNNGIGDKSQGWATQNQLPGQYRKKQRR